LNPHCFRRETKPRHVRKVQLVEVAAMAAPLVARRSAGGRSGGASSELATLGISISAPGSGAASLRGTSALNMDADARSVASPGSRAAGSVRRSAGGGSGSLTEPAKLYFDFGILMDGPVDGKGAQIIPGALRHLATIKDTKARQRLEKQIECAKRCRRLTKECVRWVPGYCSVCRLQVPHAGTTNLSPPTERAIWGVSMVSLAGWDRAGWLPLVLPLVFPFFPLACLLVPVFPFVFTSPSR
jgi:hypothetical protein